MAYRGNFRGGAGFARPENALKRADELENVGQKHAALQALHDIITSKKHRTWSKVYESIMFKHIDLCVEMKKRNYGKEALMQYRNMCQQVNINSLEEVIKYFLKKAGDKAEEAQQKAAAATIDMEDLDEDASPEDLMLSYVSAEKGKDRTDRELVTPWFRFLWETYRCVLDILRTNPKLEALYAMTANRAFQFCLQYKRTAEFRRLCDILRQHLAHLTNRYRDQRESPQDSLQLHLETRFEQLRVACELELWAEAFRSVEDIQALILLAKKSPKQQLMATYYARLTQIFAVSENHLYHAYAWLKLFNFSKSYNKNLTQSDLQQMACSVLLATLSIVPYERNDAIQRQDENQAEQEKERILRMANILGFSVDAKKDYRNLLTRGGLLASINSMHILSLAPPEIRAIYDLLTSDFAPLELCSRLSPLLDKLSEMTSATPMSGASPVKDVQLQQYIGSLRQVAILRLLKQLSEVYSEMKIPSFAALVPFVNFSEVEAVIVDGVKHRFLQVRIDHRNGTLHFGAQQLEGDRTRSHLSTLAKRLSKAITMTSPVPDQEKEARRAAAVAHALEVTENDHKLAIARKLIIEKRKEEAELAMLEAEKEAELRRIQVAREAEIAEEKRRREEMLRREKERIEKELEEREMEEARALLEQQKKKLGAGAKPKDGEKLDKRTIMAEAMQERLKDQQELERKLNKQAKQLDHLERARREEETPYILAAYEKRQAEDKQYHEEQQTMFREQHRKTWEADILEKKRLAAMTDERAKFQAQIMSRRAAEFEALKRQRERVLAERKQQRAIERENARRKEFVRQARDRVMARVEELEEEAAAKALAAQAEREKEAEAERQRVAQRIKEKEAEMERKAAEERAAAPERSAAAAPATKPSSASSYVPIFRRTTDAASSASGDKRGNTDEWSRRDSAAPAAGAAAATSSGASDRWSRPAALRDERPSAFGSREREDRDRPSAGAFGSSRDEGGDRWRARDSGAAPPAPADKFVPRRLDGSGDRPQARGSEAPPTNAARPAAAANKFVPSARRNQS